MGRRSPGMLLPPRSVLRRGNLPARHGRGAEIRLVPVQVHATRLADSAQPGRRGQELGAGSVLL